MEDCDSAFNEISTGYTPTDNKDVCLHEILRLENLSTPTPLESTEAEFYPECSTIIKSMGTENWIESGTLFYCHPGPDYYSTDVPTTMLNPYTSSSTYTDSVKPLQCLEVDTCYSCPNSSGEYFLGYETGGSAPSIDNSLSPPTSFCSSADNTMAELKVPVSSYDHALGAVNGTSAVKVEENATYYCMQPASFPHKPNDTCALRRPQTLTIVNKSEPLDPMFDQLDPLMVNSNNPVPTYKVNSDYMSGQPKWMPPETSQIVGTSSRTNTARIEVKTKTRATKQNKNLEKSFFCSEPGCTKRFSRMDELKRHQRIHSDIKQYSCEICGKGFTRSDHLKTHRRTHTGERPYKCPHCERCFARSDECNRHAKVHFRDKSKCGRKPKHVELLKLEDGILSLSSKSLHTPPSRAPDTSGW